MSSPMYSTVQDAIDAAVAAQASARWSAPMSDAASSSSETSSSGDSSDMSGFVVPYESAGIDASDEMTKRGISSSDEEPFPLVAISALEASRLSPGLKEVRELQCNLCKWKFPPKSPTAMRVEKRRKGGFTFVGRTMGGKGKVWTRYTGDGKLLQRTEVKCLDNGRIAIKQKRF